MTFLSGLRSKRGLFICSIFILFSVFCSFQLQTPPIEDEVLHHRCKIIWFEKGSDWCELAHSPLYHEATSAWQYIWGPAYEDEPESVAVFRSFGIFTSFITLLVFLWAALKRPKGIYLLLVFPVLALHPYFVQFTTHLDYDSTVLVAPLLLAAILIESWDKNSKPDIQLTAFISSVLGFAIFAKELTPLILIFLWPVWAYLRKFRNPQANWRPYFFHAVIGAVLSIFIGFLYLKAWAILRDHNWYDPLLLSKEKFFGRKSSGGFLPWQTWGMSRFLFLTYIPYLWIGLPFFYLLLKSLIKKHSANPLQISFPVFAGLAIFAAYSWLVQAGFYFPKYTQPAWPLLVYGLWLALPEDGLELDFSIFKSPKFIFSLALLFGLGVCEFFDPIMIVEDRTNLTLLNVSKHILSVIIPFSILLLASRISRKSATAVFMASLCVYYVGIDTGHLFRKHSTKYLYGEHGFLETISKVKNLKLSVSPYTMILTTGRDLQWYMGRAAKFIEPTEFNELSNSVTSAFHEAKIFVSRSYGTQSISSYPQLKQLVDKSFACHTFIDTPGQRFEWWWKPIGPNCDKL